MENKTEAVYTRLPNCNNPLLSFLSSLLMINIINTCNHLPRYMLLMSQVSASHKTVLFDNSCNDCLNWHVIDLQIHKGYHYSKQYIK
mgnify:CR=1 FL=1